MRNLSNRIKLISQYLSFIYKKQAMWFVLGMTAHSVINFIFTVILNGYLVVKFTLITATTLMFFANIAKVLTMILVYDIFQNDVFGIELLKTNEEDSEKNRVVKKIRKLLQRLERFGSFQIKVILIVVDNFFGVIYVRPESRKYNCIPKKIWSAFILGMFLATIGMTMGAKIIQEIYRLIRSLYLYIF